MRKSLLLAVLLLAVPFVRGGDLVMRVVVNARVPATVIGPNAPEAKNWKEYKDVSFRIYLINTGKREIRVATSGLEVIDARQGARLTEVRFVALENSNSMNIREIVAESTLGVVALRENEAAVLIYETTKAAVDAAEVEFVYEVPEKFAERYGLWGGRVSAKGSTPRRVP